MAENTLIVRIVGDEKQYLRSLAASSAATNKFARDVSKVGETNQLARGVASPFGNKGSLLFGSTAFIGGAVAASSIKGAVEAASNLNEQVSKSRVVFGQSSADIEKWAKSSATNLGLARDQAIETAGSFGALFKPLGVVGPEAAKQSERLTQLGADLASFYNTDVQDALDAIKSGLVGESEPLRRYGVLLSETRVQQQALADTGKESATQLTAQEKVMARLELIFKDSTVAQGDFQRTSTGLANQTRILKANARDLEITLGTQLLPTITTLVQELNKGAGAALDFADAIGNIKVPDLPFIGSGGGTIGEGFQKRFRVGLEVGNPVAIGFSLSHKATNWLFGGGPAPELPTLSARVEFESDFNSLNRLERDAQKAAGNAFGTPGFKPGGAPPVGFLGFTPEQRRSFFDASINRRLDRVQDLKSLDQQIAALAAIRDDIKKRQAVTKDTTRQLTLEDQIVAINRQISADVDQKRQNALDEQTKRAQDAKEAAEKAKAAAEKAAAARHAAQLALLGLDENGQPFAPGNRALSRLTNRVNKELQGTFLDTTKTKSLITNIRRLLSGELGKLDDDVRRSIEHMLHNLDEAVKNHDVGGTGEQTKFQKTGIDAILRGMGLTADQIRELRFRLARIGPGGTISVPQPSAFGRAIPDTVINTTVNLDGEKIGSSSTRYSQRAAGARAVQRGGRFAGKRLGMG